MGPVTAGPSLSRGDIYGGEQGKYSATQEASGPTETGPAPALIVLAGVAVLIAIRLLYENAD